MIEGRVLVYGLMADRAPRAYIRRGSCLKGVPGDAWDPTVLAPGTFRGATISRLVEGTNVHGVTELFPVSSLCHSVLLPALAGGQWAKDLNVSAPESPYLAFIVGLHVAATAAALLVFFWRDWLRILAGFATSLRVRRIQTRAERPAWLIVLATIPVGLAGLALEHLFRSTLGKPIPAAVFLIVNGGILLGGERLRRRCAGRP
jgi:undecaprenyl pyrophosphate phosphatase UppP